MLCGCSESQNVPIRCVLDTTKDIFKIIFYSQVMYKEVNVDKSFEVFLDFFFMFRV